MPAFLLISRKSMLFSMFIKKWQKTLLIREISFQF